MCNSVNFGRAPVRTVLHEALEVLRTNKDKLSGFVTHRMSLLEAPHAYAMFEKHQARKIVLLTR